MLNLIQADLFKWRKAMAAKMLLAVSAACAAVMTLFAALISQGRIGDSLTGIGFMFSDINVISILGAVAASLLICGDFDNKSIQDAVTGGIGKLSIIAGKTGVLLFILAGLLLPYALVTGIALGMGGEFNMGAVSIGFLNVLTSESGSAISAAETWKLVAVALTLFIVYAAQLSICVPLAFWLKKPVFVIAIYYGFSILTGQLLALSQSSPAFDRIFSFTPYGGAHVLTALDTGTGDMAKSIAVSLVFIALMIAAAYGLFRKAEIK